MFTIIDLTQPLDLTSRAYPGTAPVYTAERVDVGDADVLVSRFAEFELHGGTHLDAPLHFAPHGEDVASLPLRLLPAIVVRVRGPRIERDMIPQACDGHAILFSTGWDTRAGTRGYFEGYPCLAPDAAQELVARGAALIGLDTPSVDDMPERPTYPSHRILCRAGIPIVEGLVNLGRLLTQEPPVLFAAFPLPFAGVEASPVRAVALVPETPPG